MDVTEIKNNLLNLNLKDSSYISDAGIQVADDIRNKRLAIINLVEGLDQVLTNFSHIIRYRGVELLCHVVTSLDKDSLNQKEIEVLSEFACMRLIDHKSMEMPTLKCLSYFIDCKNKPARFNKTTMEFLSTKINIRKMDAKSRNQVYEIAKKIVIERRSQFDTIDSDLIYSLVHMIEGESSPENLLLCFGIVSYVMKNFRDLEPFVDDLFEWLSSYYPIDYTPNEQNSVYGFNIMRSDLVNALYDCFYANELNSANLQTLLLEKLESSMLSTKLESLNCLTKCYQVFPLASVKDYATSLWTAIRMECLKRLSSVDTELLEASYRALVALTTKLGEDDGIYFNFVSDICEELTIAFRKPEMDLFEPAARLLFNVALPKPKGINYILSKILPLANAVSAKELKPFAALAYIFEELMKHDSTFKLSSALIEPLETIIAHATENIGDNEDAIRLLNAITKSKIELSIIDSVIGKLLLDLQNSRMDIEECLALICANYKRTDVLFDEKVVTDCDLRSLMKQVTFYKQDSPETEFKFLIYLRLLTLLADSCDRVELAGIGQSELLQFFSEIRTFVKTRCNQKLVNSMGLLHAIIINKIGDEYINPILISFFNSEYCQSLVSSDSTELNTSSYIHLSLIQWILKSLVLRNHHFTAPLINLVLNFITSEHIDVKLALLGAQVFRFVLEEDPRFNRERKYQVFALYKQKFYAQTSKELRIRYLNHKDDLKKHLLICTLAAQIPNLPPSVYKSNYEWLLRELLIILSNSCGTAKGANAPKIDEELTSIVYQCLETLIRCDTSGDLLGLIESLVDLNLTYAKDAETLSVRKSALICLTTIATTLKDSQLLLLRSKVVDGLKPCLSDRKRIVRQAAAEARMKWIMIGQPVGS